MKTPKNIVLVTSEFPPLPGGIGNHAFNLAKHLTKNDFDVEVITDQRTTDKIEVEFDASLPFTINRIGLMRPRMFMYFKRLWVLFKLVKTNTKVIASGKFSLWSVAFLSLLFKRHYVAVIHGTEVNFSNSILKFFVDKALLRFNKVIAVSNYTKDLVSYLNLKDITVITNGFDASSWNPMKDKTMELKGHPKLLTVGSVTERKGQLQVIKHLPELIKTYPNLHYHCVGHPIEAKTFLKEAHALKVTDHITFHGSVSHDNLQDFYNASNVFIMLSGTTVSGDVEGFGIAILEANHFGIPAIGAKDCGIEDAIKNKSSGVLIDRTNSDAFLNALKTIISNQEHYAEASRAWALQHTWDKVILKYIDAIKDL